MGQYELLMDAPAAIAIMEGPDHTFRLANDNYLQLVGPERDLIGESVRDAFPELAEQGFYDLLDGVYATKKPFVGNEIPVMLADPAGGEAKQLFVNFVYQPIIGDDGDATGIFVHATDVTEPVLNRQAIDEARSRYRMVLGSVDEGFCVIEVMFDDKDKPYDYRFVETNENFEAQTGLVGAVGKTARELVPGLEKHWFEMYGKVAKTGTAVQFSQGSETMGRWFDVQATKVGDKDETYVALLFKDVTAAKNAERELRKQVNLVEAIMNNTVECLCLIDGDGRVTYMNPSAVRTTGRSLDEAVGASFHDLVHHSKADGTPYPESECPLHGAYKAKEPLPETSTVFFRKDGSRFPVRINSTPIGGTGDLGNVVEFRDVTETEQLKELNRTKDEFIALASHQLRTPVTAVKQYLGVVMDGYAGPVTEDQLQYLTTANNANDRQLTIIEDLLKTARIDTRGFGLTLTRQDLVATVDEIVRQYKPMADAKSQEIRFTHPAKLTAPFDKTEIGVCVANLLENALKYSPARSDVAVTLLGTPQYATLTVTDRGVGIDEKDLGKIFEKFTRIHNELSDTVSGSGLGLYWVRRIIDIHKGTLTIDSKLGKGTTFTIRLKR